MNLSTLVDLISNDWVLIESKAKRLTFRLGEEIIREGTSIQHLYVIRKGSASVEIAGVHSRATIATLAPGDICGEIAFLVDSRATAAVIAKEDVEVDAISAIDLRELIQTFPGFGVRFYHSLAVLLGHRLRQTSQELLRVMVLKG